MTRGVLALIVIAAALIAVPLAVTNDFYLNLASQILIYALLAVSLNLLVGYGGMVSLGHASFIGLTSYSAVLMLNAGFGQLPSALLAILFSTACGGLFGLLALGDFGIRFSARPRPFGFDISSAPSFYWFTLFVFAVALFFIWRLTRSPFGAALQGARDQPRRMRMLGHNVWLIQWLTFVLASFWG